jgi:hypothetical protein
MTARNNTFGRTLTSDQSILLQFYIDSYTRTEHQIDLLYQSLDEIREQINNINNNSYSQVHANTIIGRDPIPITHQVVNDNMTSRQRRRQRRRRSNSNVRQSTHPQSQTQQPNITHAPQRSAQNPARNVNTERSILGTPYVFEFSRYIPTESTTPITRTNPTNNTPTTSTNVYTSSGNIQDFTNDLTHLINAFTEPVPIRPSETVLNNATRRVQYANIVRPLNTSCPITLERFEDSNEITQILGCGHIFNSTGINSWFRNNVRCPVCRYDIRNYVRARTDSSLNPVQPTTENNRTRPTPVVSTFPHSNILQ